MDHQVKYQLEGLLNFRDVGLIINQYTGTRYVREGLLYRSARPDQATAKDKAVLHDDMGLKTIIDLRSDTEHRQVAEKRQAQHAELEASQNNGRAGDICFWRIKDVDYQEIKITGRAFEIQLLRQLSWWYLFKFIVLFILGYRLDAISILAKQVMLPRGLIGLNDDTIDCSGAEIRRTLNLYTKAQSLPILVHCTQGKDRTGLICALVLMILGVSSDAIEHDYLLSDAELATERHDRIAEMRQVGLPAAWAWTDKNMISSMEMHLKEQYGGLNTYLDQIGFDEGDRQKIRENLLY